MSILNRASNNPYPGSHYVDKVEIDFEDLPNDIINTGILWHFEPRSFNLLPDNSEWKSNWELYLNDLPEKYRLTTARKAVEFAKKALAYYLENKFDPRHNDTQTQDIWRRRIDLAEDILAYHQRTQVSSFPDYFVEPRENENYPKEFTIARQVLVFHYLFKYFKIEGVDATEKARFIQFLTGRETGASDIRNTNIYKRLTKPFSNDNKTLNADLSYIRTYFEKLKLHEIAKMITNEISKSDF